MSNYFSFELQHILIYIWCEKCWFYILCLDLHKFLKTSRTNPTFQFRNLHFGTCTWALHLASLHFSTFLLGWFCFASKVHLIKSCGRFVKNNLSFGQVHMPSRTTMIAFFFRFHTKLLAYYSPHFLHWKVNLCSWTTWYIFETEII